MNIHTELSTCDSYTCRGRDKRQILSLFLQQREIDIHAIAKAIHRGIAYTHSLLKECQSLEIDRTGKLISNWTVKMKDPPPQITETEAKRILDHAAKYGTNDFTERQMQAAYIALNKQQS